VEFQTLVLLRKKNNNAQFEDAEKVKVEKLNIIGTRGATTSTEANIVGYVRDKNSGEPVIGASVLVKNPLAGVNTDPNG